MPSHVLSRVGAHLPAITSRQPSLQNPLPRAKNVWSLGSAFFVGTVAFTIYSAVENAEADR
jgi:hypothetical protein